MPQSSKNVLKWLYGSVTQGGADAFVQGSITTPFGVDKTIGVIEMIDIIWPSVSTAVAATLEWALTVKSFAAMPVLATDRSLLVYRKRQALGASVASYWSVMTLIAGKDWPVDMPLIMAEPTLYQQFDSASTTLTQSLSIRIGYREDTMNDADRFALQAARLAS